MLTVDGDTGDEQARDQRLWTVIVPGALALHDQGVIAAEAPVGRGSGVDLDDATTAAAAEVIERYAALRPGTKPVPARWLDGASTDLPAEQVFLGRTGVTSNGLACGTSHSSAAASAVLELLERDAIMTVWHHWSPATRLHLDHWLIRALERAGVTVTLHELPAAADVSVVLAVAYGDGQNHPGAVVGAAANLDLGTAARKALTELAGNVVITRREIKAGQWREVGDPSQVRSLLDHGFFYRDPTRAVAFAFLDGGDTRSVPGKAGRAPRLEELTSRCSDAGIRVAVADITPADVAAKLGLHVVRAVSDDLVPLWFGHDHAPRDHPRLRGAAGNVWPHPFA